MRYLSALPLGWLDGLGVLVWCGVFGGLGRWWGFCVLEGRTLLFLIFVVSYSYLVCLSISCRSISFFLVAFFLCFVLNLRRCEAPSCLPLWLLTSMYSTMCPSFSLFRSSRALPLTLFCKVPTVCTVARKLRHPPSETTFRSWFLFTVRKRSKRRAMNRRTDPGETFFSGAIYISFGCVCPLPRFRENQLGKFFPGGDVLSRMFFFVAVGIVPSVVSVCMRQATISALYVPATGTIYSAHCHAV